MGMAKLEGDGIGLRMIGISAGPPRFRFLAVEGCRYRLLGSVDLDVWHPLQFKEIGSQSDEVLRDSYRANRFEEVEIEASLSGELENCLSFKLQIG